MSRKQKSGGFTLIELSLAMTFIGILSVIVVVLIQNVSASYRRGVTLNQINTVGMDVIDDLRSSVQNASSDEIKRLCSIKYGYGVNNSKTKCEDDNAMSFIYLKKTAKISIDGATAVDMPIYGVVCTGTYTYVWNSGYLFTNNDSDVKVSVDGHTSLAEKKKLAATVTVRTGLKYENFRLLKVYDNERRICIRAINSYHSAAGKESSDYTKSSELLNKHLPRAFSLNVTDSNESILADPNDDNHEAVELLSKNNNLVLYDLYFAPPAMSGARGNLFYSGSMILGTMNGGINIRVAGNSCKPPNDTSGYESLQYCAINKFNFAMMAGG